ncbi:alpha/beta hydrolase [Lachnospiraceae bacterium 50-23]
MKDKKVNEKKVIKLLKSKSRKGLAAVSVFCVILCFLTACGGKPEKEPQGKAEQSEAEEENEMKNKTEHKIQTREYRDIAYDTLSQSQKFDLYLPETGEGPFPLIMFIHGGGWFAGDKADGQENAWVTLREKGYAVASINYRLSGEAPHPSGIIDCKTALRFLKAHADEYHIKADRVAVSGDSAGGHYALMVALTSGESGLEDLSRGNPEQTSEVACAVAWYPAVDLADIMRSALAGEYQEFDVEYMMDAVERYTGKKVSEISEEALEEASPVRYVTEDMPPVLIQHGDADTVCPVEHSRRLYEIMVQTAGENKAELDIMEGADHAAGVFESAENMERIVRFLEKSGVK